ncbi:MAG: hypothetical protein KTR26_12095 [Flammeovirgaceae bacterium]|nr:hypothetical protein [Flammeovirgaceae bacterium]
MIWQPNTQVMGDDGFKATLTAVVDVVEKEGLNKIYVDARQYFHTLVPELQTWHDSQIVPKYIKVGVKRIAFVMPEDFFNQVAIEQTFEEDTAIGSLQTQYFGSESEAKGWLNIALVA